MDDPTTIRNTHTEPIRSKDGINRSEPNISMTTKIQCNDKNHDNNMSSQMNTGESVTENKKPNISNLSVYNDPMWYKKLILKELNIESNSDEYKNLINGNNDNFNNFVKIKIIHRSQELEELKSQNLDKLNVLIDKCIKCDKFDSVTFNNIFGIINTDNNNTMNNMNSENKVPSILRSSKSNVLSNTNKKRKLEIPNNHSPKLASPRGYEKHTTEISSIQKDSDLLYQSNDIMNQSNNFIQPYQLPAPGMLSNNQPTVVPSNWQSYADPNCAYSTGYVINSQHQHMSPQNPSNVGLYVPQTFQPAQPYPLHGYKILQDRQYRIVPQPISESVNPVDPNNTYNVENPYYKVPTQHLNYPEQQHLATPGARTSPYRQPLPPLSKSLKKGHRRTQSASVSFGSYSNSNIEFRSPQTFNNSKPVNFLIHTPKHPPPS